MAEKIPECDREAARLLSLQMKNAPGARCWDGVLTAVFLAAIFLFAAFHLILPDREQSETENRTLAQLPEFSLKAAADGSYTKDIAEYLADQFPARDFFVTLKAAAETALGKGANNGVMFGRGGTLVTRDDLPDLDNMRSNLASMDRFAEMCAKRGIPSAAAIAGRSADVLDHTLPAHYGSYYSDRLWAAFEEAAEPLTLAFINLRDPLRKRAAAGEYVYYRTDHHWTTYGAYCGYAEIAPVLGIVPFPAEDFERQTVSLAFYGTTWSTAGASWIGADEMEYFRFGGDDCFTTTLVDGGESFAGFYDTEYLAKKDKYSSFISGNHALVTVFAPEGEERETLLLVKDSFAHAAVPFLARHYDLVIVDLRYYKLRTADLLDEYGIDRVLYLMNIASLCDSTVFRMLEAGLGA